jgi:hypothetical protein
MDLSLQRSISEAETAKSDIYRAVHVVVPFTDSHLILGVVDKFATQLHPC